MASDVPDVSAAANSTVDPYDFVGFVRNSDGSITRKPIIPITPATPDPDKSSPVLTKDVPLNQSIGTWVRIFLPREAAARSPPSKLPLIVYYHGGGFILGSAGSTMFTDFCDILAVETRSVIVSVDYRLAPEHRLPAAFDDCFEALHWIRTAQDEWLTNFVDLSSCFLMGLSAGGTIAYYVGLRAITAVDDLQPLKIKGLILQQPYFGGVQRTRSEVRLLHDKILPACVVDLMWDMSLPIGVDRDHEYCNPMVGFEPSPFDQMKRLGWKILVTGCDGDPLFDRQIELTKMLEGKGIDVIGRFCEGFNHGFELFDLSKRKEFCSAVLDFMY